MKGFLVVNHFLNWDKFDTLYDMLIAAFQSEGIELKKVTNVELMSPNDTFLCKTEMAVSSEKPDFVLFWDKDIRLAKKLEAHGIKVFNSSRALEVCDDKSLTATELINSEIIMPKTVIAPKTYKNEYADLNFLENAGAIIGYPMIVKECFGSFGMQVYLVNSIIELKNLVEKIGAKPMIFQEYIKTSAGKDIRIHVVGGRVIAAVKRVAAPGEYRANATNGGKMYPYVPTKDEERIAIKSCELLGVDFAGVDILFGEQPLLCEVNTNAHFKNLLDATGINVACFIAKHISKTMSRKNNAAHSF